MFNASDRTKYTSLEPVHIFLLKNAAFLSPKQHNSEYPSFRLRCSHAGPPERASGPRLCSHCRAIFFSKNGFPVITEARQAREGSCTGGLPLGLCSCPAAPDGGPFPSFQSRAGTGWHLPWSRAGANARGSCCGRGAHSPATAAGSPAGASGEGPAGCPAALASEHGLGPPDL